MEVSALASGSSGNCFYVSSKDNGILVDAGISAKQIKLRLQQIKRKVENIKAIFITHEHSDHVRGADVFARQFNIPIFATKGTAQNCFLCSNEKLINIIKNNECIKINGFEIEAFSKSHKAADPVSFSIAENKRISIITDAGHACKNVISHVKDADTLFFESNHDLDMLESGPYPYYLKKWIKSDLGHLSNKQAGLCILEHASSRMKNIVLAHLSQTNNTPEIALSSFQNLMKERLDMRPRTIVSERSEPTPLIKI